MNDITKWIAIFVSVTALVIAQVTITSRTAEKVENLKESNTRMEERNEKRDAKFDKFIMQETKKSVIDSMKTDTLMKFIEQQMIFNQAVQEHIIKQGE